MSISMLRTINLAALTMFAGTGLMHAAPVATFHLPVEVHWGHAVLEPGDYKISMPEPANGQVHFRIEGANSTIYELPLVTNQESNSDASYLQLSEVDGAYYISAFSSGTQGKSFVFSVPKASRTPEERGSTVSVVAVDEHKISQPHKARV